MSENRKAPVIAKCSKRGALSVEAETGGMFSFVSALPIPSPGWERARVRGIKKADSDNFVSEQEPQATKQSLFQAKIASLRSQ